MLFSVITPTHHRPESLKKLLHSLEKQSFDKNLFEVILVPSPRDQSLPWILDYQSRTPLQLRVLDGMKDPYEGRSASFKRNHGASQARGTWLAFIDDDCVAHTDWLMNADLSLRIEPAAGLEGLTEIPLPEEPTLTYKGLQRLSRPDGYQTCNMIYDRKTFLEIGGFDLNFPFYLEDTDLAWSFLDRNKKILFSDKVVVQHPVPAPDVKRYLANAKRVRQLPYLYKKHPSRFKQGELRPLERVQWFFLGLYLILFIFIAINPSLVRVGVATGVVVVATLGYLVRWLWGCRFSFSEALHLALLIPVAPLVAGFQLLRGNLENRTWLWTR